MFQLVRSPAWTPTDPSYSVVGPDGRVLIREETFAVASGIADGCNGLPVWGELAENVRSIKAAYPCE